MKITSVQNQTIKDLVKLQHKKHRDEKNQLLIEGDHLIEEATRANLLIETYGLENEDVIISDNVAKKLSQTKSGSKRFALIHKPKQTLVEGARFLVLDKVQDPGNVGTCIRSAYSFGYDGVILSFDSADEFNDKSIRASQGAIFHIPTIRMDLK
ncbi:MAG TPA: TrmH family RNA methyltransferase, partial [Erysipelothrix sp.]|nr:TrmH family RNA methyltransferase [Erysipelothrix sp.]